MDRKSIILLLMLIAIPISGMGIDIYTPSLPAITHAFDANHHWVKLSISVYLLGLGLGQLVTGPLSDSYGRKKVLLFGLFLFIVFSILTALVTDIHYFLIMRFLQGLAVTTPVVIAKSMASDSFVGNELKKASTYLVTAWSLGPIIAPAIGGYLQSYIGWQANFYFLAAYALVTLLLVVFLMPETNNKLIVFSLKNIFCNYKKIILNINFIGCGICLAIGYSQIAIFNVIGPFIIQEGFQLSPLSYGHIALVLGLACFLGSISNRFFIRHFDQKSIITCGIALMLLFSISLLVLLSTLELNIVILLSPIFLLFFSVGFVYPNCSSICLSMFPEMAGSASAIMGVITILGTSIITSGASMLETQAAKSLANFYVILSIFMILVYKFMVYRKKRQNCLLEVVR